MDPRYKGQMTNLCRSPPQSDEEMYALSSSLPFLPSISRFGTTINGKSLVVAWMIVLGIHFGLASEIVELSRGECLGHRFVDCWICRLCAFGDETVATLKMSALRIDAYNPQRARFALVWIFVLDQRAGDWVGLVGDAELGVWRSGFCPIIIRIFLLTSRFFFDCLTCPLIRARNRGIPMLSCQVHGI